MADFVFTIAKGRVAEFYRRVENKDPANSALMVAALAVSGLESDAVLRDVGHLLRTGGRHHQRGDQHQLRAQGAY